MSWAPQSSFWFTFCFFNWCLWLLHIENTWNMFVSLAGSPGGSVWAESGQHDHQTEESHLDGRAEGENSSSDFCAAQSVKPKCTFTVTVVDLLDWSSCHVPVLGLWAEWVEEDHRAAEEAERCCSGCHQRSHQHTWAHTERGKDRYTQTLHSSSRDF